MSLKHGLRAADPDLLGGQVIAALAIEVGEVDQPKNVVLGSPTYNSLALVVQEQAEAGASKERLIGMWLAFEGLARLAEAQDRRAVEALPQPPQPRHTRLTGFLRQLWQSVPK